MDDEWEGYLEHQSGLHKDLASIQSIKVDFKSPSVIFALF